MTQNNAPTQLKKRVIGTGPKLVLLHGWGMNSGAFEQWLPYLTSRFEVTLLDLPGFGVNAHALPVEYTLPALVDSIAPYIDDDSFLVGWSMGGLVAQALAACAGLNLAGLITVGSTPHFMQSSEWSGIRKEVLELFAQQLSGSFDKTLDRFLAIQAMGSPNGRNEMRELKRHIKIHPDPHPDALKGGLNLLAEADIRLDIKKIKVPTLRLYGKKDTLVPVSAVDDIHAMQPHADNVVLPDAAHAPFMSHPERVTQIIDNFIDSVLHSTR